MILSDFFFDFIQSHLDDDPDRLLLSPSKELDHDMLRFAVLQIALRKKFNSKFPGLLSCRHFLFPDRSVAEQASSEATASYMTHILHDARRIVDLTAGLGVNAASFAVNAEIVTAIELSEERADILRHNLKALGIDNVSVVCDDCCNWVAGKGNHYDLAFIDPARRDEKGNRSISLVNHSPDILQLISDIRNRADRLFIKVSPLYDLDRALNEIPEISTFHLVEYRGECKELILDIDFKKTNPNPIVRCVEVFDCQNPKIKEYPFIRANINEKDYLVGSDDEIKDFSYLYLPSPSIRKARIVDKLLLEFPGMKLLSANTMLFVSSKLYEDFPGKILHIEGVLNKKELKSMKGRHCNVIARNYPLTSEALAARFSLKPSGPSYLVATTLPATKLLLHAKLLFQPVTNDNPSQP